MKINYRIPVLIIGTILAASLVFIAVNQVRAQTWQSGMPVRCEIYIDPDHVGQNVPVECYTPDGNEYYNVPEGLYLYVTDIIVKRRLTSQTTVAASVRIWEDDFSSTTGCSPLGTGVTGNFVTDMYITLADSSITGQEHMAFNTPYLVLTPNDCLAVYTSTTSGLIVEISGYQWTSLGVPVAHTFLPSIMSDN